MELVEVDNTREELNFILGAPVLPPAPLCGTLLPRSLPPTVHAMACPATTLLSLWGAHLGCSPAVGWRA